MYYSRGSWILSLQVVSVSTSLGNLTSPLSSSTQNTEQYKNTRTHKVQDATPWIEYMLCQLMKTMCEQVK